jgi:hypothetical protein
MVNPHVGGDSSFLTENVNLKYSKVNFNFIKGDVMVMQPHSRSTEGHVAGYDGRNWVSDFVQRDFWAGSKYRDERPDYAVYRY